MKTIKFDFHSLGVERFSNDIRTMLGHPAGIYWKICWKFVAPLFILVSLSLNIALQLALWVNIKNETDSMALFCLQWIMIFGLVQYTPHSYDAYVYPWEANFIGWCVALSSVLCIPLFAVIAFIRASGTPAEVGHIMCLEPF